MTRPRRSDSALSRRAVLKKAAATGLTSALAPLGRVFAEPGRLGLT